MYVELHGPDEIRAKIKAAEAFMVIARKYREKMWPVADNNVESSECNTKDGD